MNTNQLPLSFFLLFSTNTHATGRRKDPGIKQFIYFLSLCLTVFHLKTFVGYVTTVDTFLDPNVCSCLFTRVHQPLSLISPLLRPERRRGKKKRKKNYISQSQNEYIFKPLTVACKIGEVCFILSRSFMFFNMSYAGDFSVLLIINFRKRWCKKLKQDLWPAAMELLILKILKVCQRFKIYEDTPA